MGGYKEPLRQAPIGVFDSGVGGLSIFREVRRQLPNEALLYLADQAHVPYGTYSRQDVHVFTLGCANYLLEQGCKAIVVACNSASGAALQELRFRFPAIPFVGMVPAVKPAAEATNTGVIGVLATEVTLNSELYSDVLDQFATNITILENHCQGLVEQIENQNLEGQEVQRILEGALLPMLNRGIDQLVLGCTHYPFVIPAIQKIVQDRVHIIDPAPAVARQVRAVLENNGILNSQNQPGLMTFTTTGKPDDFTKMLDKTLGIQNDVEGLVWHGVNIEPIDGRKTDL